MNMEEIENDETRKEYIRAKYVSESVIPKEIFTVYKQIPENVIEDEIHDVCKLCKEIEKPLPEKPINRLFVIKQCTKDYVLKEDGKEVDKIVFYENMNKVYRFSVPGIGNISWLHTRYWKPAEITRIEGDLRKIHKLSYRTRRSFIPTNEDNFMIMRGYFGSKMINLILIRDYFYRPLAFKEINGEKIASDEEITRLKENEYAEIVEQIANVLDNRKSTLKNRTRIMLVDMETFREIKSIGAFNTNIRGDIGYALMCFNDKNREGVLIEYQKDEQEALELYPNIVFLKQAKDVVKKVNFNNLGKKTKRYKMNDFKKPIVKSIIFSKPKKNKHTYQYERLSMFHIMRFSDDKTRERLEELYPDSLYMKIRLLSNNKEENTKREIVNKLFRKLDKLKN